MKNKTIIIVPCFNEAARLDAGAFLDFVTRTQGVAFLFVNDGSTDGTGRVLEELCAQSPERLSYLHLTRNSGKAEAVRQGFVKAFSSDAEFVGYFDADLAAPLAVIPELEALLLTSGRDIAMGARVKLLGRRIRRNEQRHLLGRIFATAASGVLGVPVYDTQCGAKLFRRTASLEKIFSFPFTVRWIFDVEILARFVMLHRFCGGASLEVICIEHPLQEWVDRKGSKLKACDFLTSAMDLVKIMSLLRARDKKDSYHQKLC